MFELGEAQRQRLEAWNDEQDAIVIQCQLDSDNAFIRSEARQGYAYYGACGGHLTYCFTPTSLGDILVVKHSGTGAEIDLTDYKNW